MDGRDNDSIDLSGSSVKQSQLQLGIDFAPQALVDHGYRDAHLWPLVSPDVERPQTAYRVHASGAWGHPYVELRSGNSFPIMAFDVDGKDAVDRLREAIHGADLPAPSFVTWRRSSGNAHAVYCLERPVHRQDRARRAPLEYLARISEFYHQALRADPGFRGVLCLNPVWDGGEFVPQWLRHVPFPLDELAEPIPARWRRPRVAQTGVGRNNDLFGWSIKEAHRPRWGRLIGAAAVKDVPAWEGHVQMQNANVYGDARLPRSEVRSIARSAAGYSLRQFSEEAYQKRQSFRGVLSGEARRLANEERDELIRELRSAGCTQAMIAADVGLSQGQVSRILKVCMNHNR